MENERLGLLRAAVIVFVSGLVVGVVLPMLFPMSFLWTVFGPSGSGRVNWTGLILWGAVNVALQAIVVVGGVQLFAFRVSFVGAAFALALSTVVGFAVGIAIGYVTISSTADDPTGIAGAAFSGIFFPLVLAIGILLPAVFIDNVATPRTTRNTPEPTYPPFPPYPPEPEPRR